jgi:hypothetical protein
LLRKMKSAIDKGNKVRGKKVGGSVWRRGGWPGASGRF